MRYRKTASITALTLAAAAGSALIAGPLTPPAGPVAPTFKTLGDVEPRIAVNALNTPGDATCVFKITQGGSYYLTGDITGVPGKFTIQISADHVTLDLSGFTLKGGAMGVFVEAPAGQYRANVTIRNGSVTGCANGGVVATATDGGVLADVTAQSCPGGGLTIGRAGRMERCTANHCGSGLYGSTDSRIIDCQAGYNATWGVELHNGATIERSTSSHNGFRGISAWNEVTVRDCRVAGNGEAGIDAIDRCVIDSCVVQGNTTDGVQVGAASAVTSCRVDGNGRYGILIGSGRVTDCTLYSNSTSLALYAGIATEGPGGTRIEGNTIANTFMGIMPTSGGCVVINNNGYGCPNFIGPVAAINTVGPIVAPMGGSLTNTHPWANFVH